MGRLARSYVALVRMGLVEALTYRAQVMVWLVLGLVPLIMLAVWLAVVDQVGPAGGWRRGSHPI